MEKQERALLRRVARAYVREEGRYARYAERGATDLATAALARMQMIESCIEIKERSQSWRETAAG
ncbi:MAG TPA: hypothetical protein VKR31_10345 [Rhizomicrobium sp.]|nr:hypothetical protein [Rhizomicrobium sp.]